MWMLLFQISKNFSAQKIKSTITTKQKFLYTMTYQLRANLAQPCLNTFAVQHFLVTAKCNLQFSSPPL